jgi:hypothetical protein
MLLVTIKWRYLAILRCKDLLPFFISLLLLPFFGIKQKNIFFVFFSHVCAKRTEYVSLHSLCYACYAVILGEAIIYRRLECVFFRKFIFACS